MYPNPYNNIHSGTLVQIVQGHLCLNGANQLLGNWVKAPIPSLKAPDGRLFNHFGPSAPSYRELLQLFGYFQLYLPMP